MRFLPLTLLIGLAATSTAAAHPGHGSAAAQSGVLHYLLSPVHAAGWVGAALAVVAAIRIVRARWKVRQAKVVSRQRHDRESHVGS